MVPHYDPWGLELKRLGYQYGGIKVNKYLYNGKELIEENGLQYYDYGARMYSLSREQSESGMRVLGGGVWWIRWLAKEAGLAFTTMFRTIRC